MLPSRLFAVLIVALVAYCQAEPEPSPIISSFLGGVADAAYDYGYGSRYYGRPRRYYAPRPVYQEQPVVYQQPAYQQPSYQQASPISVSQSQSTVTQA